MTATQATIEADDRVPAIWIIRDFAATPAQLFAAHTDSALFARWIGPDGMETDITVWDARDGGEWRFVQRDASGRYAFRGCFPRSPSDASCRRSPTRRIRTGCCWRR